MFECDSFTEGAPLVASDPRIAAEYLRCIPRTTGRGTVLLVGVVHDHPASLARVHTVLGAVTPDILALELPPLAMPLFHQYAADSFVPPRLGGEMSVGLQTAGAVRSVGIDAPNRSYVWRLVNQLCSTDASVPLLTDVLTDLLQSTAHAVACRLGAIVHTVFGVSPRLYSHASYATSLLDTPAVQAEDEASHLSKQQAFLRAIATPAHRQLIDETREETMAARLQTLRQDGDVVAIIGMEHLQPVAERLDEP